jgi:hypothetical protein
MYENISQKIEACQWDGSNTDEIVKFAGKGNTAIVVDSRRIIAQTADGRWKELELGWWISKNPGDDDLTLFSESSFRRFWKKID